MRASSREALQSATGMLHEVIGRDDQSVARAMSLGSELFECVSVLDGDRQLRTVLADSSVPADRRSAIARDIFHGHVSDATASVLDAAVHSTWASSREMRDGLVELGRLALIDAADQQDQREHVEHELFQLARILEREGTLTQLLSDKSQPSNRRRELFASVLYGQVTAVTEALALHAVSRPNGGPIEDLDYLAQLAASVNGTTIARVTTAVPLSADQAQALTDKLGAIYARDISIHPEVDPSLLGGAVARVGHEIIDGSIAGKLEKMRRAFA